MIKNQWLGFLMVLMLISGCQPPSVTAEVVPGIHILWIGDETTQINSLSLQTALLLTQDGQEKKEVSMQHLERAGYTAADGNLPPQIKSYLSKNPVDLVILQAFSVGQETNPDAFHSHAADWLDFFESQQVDVILFYPWRPPDQSIEAYQQMVNLTLETAWARQLPIAPLGDGWQLLTERNAEIDVFAADQKHPSAAGLYLNGAVFYSIFTGESADNHPVKLSVDFDQPDTMIVLDEDSLKIIQETAWQVLQSYHNQGEFSVFYDL